jgi:hypothetical protein
MTVPRDAAPRDGADRPRRLRGRAAWALGVSAFLVALCLVVLWEARDLPPGVFEPLGSAPAPRTVAVVIILMSLWIAFDAWRARGAPEAEPDADADADADYTPRPLDAWVVAALTVPYVLAMQARMLAFAPLTAVFLIAAIGWLTRFRLRSLPWIVTVAATVGWGGAYVFTRVFVVDLPGL